MLLACTSSPTLSPAPSAIWTSGFGMALSVRASTPTVPPAPCVPALVSPTLNVWVVPSRIVCGALAPARTGSRVDTPIAATPPVSWFASPALRPGWACPSEIMKMLVSLPAGSASAAPRLVRDPLCASAASPPSALLLRRNCRSDPCPASFVLTIVSKLKPKSTPVTVGRADRHVRDRLRRPAAAAARERPGRGVHGASRGAVAGVGHRRVLAADVVRHRHRAAARRVRPVRLHRQQACDVAGP